MMWPIYSASSALAFDRAEGKSLVDVSTTLLVINSFGSIAGPFTVMLMVGVIGDYALAVAIFIVSAVTFIIAIMRGRIVTEDTESKPASIPMSTSSIEMAQAVAEVTEEQLEEITKEASS